MLKQLKRQAQSGFTIIELLIVIAIIGILATLVLTNFQGAQAKGRDTVRKSDINSIYQKLEEFYNEKGGYPDVALTETVLPGIDVGAFQDPKQTGSQTLTSNINTTTVPTGTVAIPTSDGYVYNGYSCTGTTGSTCAKYTLATRLEKDTAGYSKVSLN